MNKIKMIICTFMAAVALTACDKEDNPVGPVEPVEPEVEVVVDDPQEEVSDQPAFSREK